MMGNSAAKTGLRSVAACVLLLGSGPAMAEMAAHRVVDAADAPDSLAPPAALFQAPAPADISDASASPDTSGLPDPAERSDAGPSPEGFELVGPAEDSDIRPSSAVSGPDSVPEGFDLPGPPFPAHADTSAAQGLEGAGEGRVRTPTEPFALRFTWKPSRRGVYVSAWESYDWWKRGGVSPSRVILPQDDPPKAPLKQGVVLDSQGGFISLETRAGGGIAVVSYAGRLEEYKGLVCGVEVLSAWRKTVLGSLGREREGVGRGLLDIDIPMPLPRPIVDAIGPGANLKVTGSERITFGGQSTYVVEALDLESGPPSKWPQLDMEQQLNVNLEGTIGRKIHVYVDHRSGGESFGAAKANEIRVRYDGDEDEIIHKIELGETNLSLPGTEFVSYSGYHEGLFGAKVSAKMGKLDLVTIASKEEGKSAGASFTGTAESDSLAINDISYAANTFFALDGDALKYSDIYLTDVSVYVDDRDGSNDIETGAQPGRAYLYGENGAPADSTVSQRGMLDELVELEDYLVDYGNGIIELTSAIYSGYVLCVAYERSDGHVVGGSAGDSLRLKMIKREERVGGTEWEPIRRYELKNIYSLGAKDIPEEGFELVIRRRTPSGEILDAKGEMTYIEILGLDTHGLGNDPDPDGLVDLEWIDFEKGYLVFPHFTPFCPDYDTTHFYYADGGEPAPEYTADELEDEVNCSIYSKEIFDPDDDVYFIQVEYNRPRTTFYLGHINIIENSEVVRLNGMRLTRGVDYTIYYPAGQLTLLAEEAKEPDAQVTVEYDYRPFGIGGEKTLLGARGVYNWSEQMKLGSTWMYQSKGTPEDRPRLGEEPSRTVVGDVNFGASFKPTFMTRLVNAIPLVATDTESSLDIAAEAAVCIPEPNTKGFVSVDDMEGTENVTMLGVVRRLWVPSSVPVGLEPADRMKMLWYNPHAKVREGDLNPELHESSPEEADDARTVMELAFDSGGPYSWAGLTRLLSKTGSDLTDYEFLEVWINDDGVAQPGTLYVDLGTLSEDFYPLGAPDGALNTEDIDRNGFDADEDTGLDNCWGDDPGCVDDVDDDYHYSYGSEDYSGINGTEGNERLDTEDLNGNWYLDTDSKYWALCVDLSDTAKYLVQDNSAVEAGNHWRLYRIPLDAARSVNGMVDWTVIKSARVWLDGVSMGSRTYMIGSMDIVGSQWETGPVRDENGNPIPEGSLIGESFKVGSKNNKEDSDYHPPHTLEYDEETRSEEREQSLVLFFEGLRSGHSATARNVFYSEQDYTGYQSLEFYVHGDSNVDDGTVFFLRVGADTANYYEYSLELRAGWLQDIEAGENRLRVPFTAFTNLKLASYAQMDTAAAWGNTSAVKAERFSRIGWPSLSRVRRVTVGVRNANEASVANTISGEIWVDDIRLGDVRKDIGWAERATIDAKFADLMSVRFDLRHMDGDFHTLKQTRGSGQENVSYNLSGTLNSDRFVSGWGVACPVTGSWKKTVTKPRFSAGSDIVLDAEESDRKKTEVVDTNLGISLSRKRQSTNFWTHLLVDALSIRGSIAGHLRTSPSRADTSRTLRGRVSYKYSPEKQGIRVFRNTQIYLKPTSVRFNVDTHVIHTTSYDIATAGENVGEKTMRTNTYDKKLNADGAIDFQFLDNLRTSHAVSVRRDLGEARRPYINLNIGVETRRDYSNSLSFSPKFGRWMSPQYSFSSSYSDEHGPQVRRAGDPPGVRDIRGRNSQEVRAGFDLKKLLGKGTETKRPPRRTRDGDTDEKEETKQQEEDEEGPGLGALITPVADFLRKMDAIDVKYSLKRNSRFDRITHDELPGPAYRLGFSSGEGADDRTQERTLTLDSGVKLTNTVKMNGMHKRTISERWYKSTVSDSIDLWTRTRSMNESTKGTMSLSGLEKMPLFTGFLKNLKARSSVEYRRSYSGPLEDPTSKGNGLSFSPLLSMDGTWRNGLSTNFSWNKKRSRSYSLSGVGSVTEDLSGSMSVSLNYRFSAPHGLKLPFFGEKLRFQSTLDCSVTLRTSSKVSRTAQMESSLSQVDPSSDTRDFSLVTEAHYTFSRNVTGGLEINFSQNSDNKRQRTRRTIGLHATAEFKF